MTREEAIEVIKDIYNYTKWDTYTTDEARTMAIKALEQKPSDDAISRQEVFDLINDQKDVFYSEGDRSLFESYVSELSPVTQQSKIGRWILIDKELSRYKCSECGEIIRLNKKNEIPSLEKDETLSDYPFSHCGAKMVEPQESEG